MTQQLHSVVLADPPWQAQGGERHYNTLPLERIKQIGIALDALLAPNAVCFLWVTNGTIPDGQGVLKAWGFEYRSLLTWIKPRLGLGSPLRNMSEHVMVGVRGKPVVKFHSQGTLKRSKFDAASF